MAATAAVLGIYELTEHIILHLPRRDIRRAQGVCKQWQHLVKTSIPIRRARCLELVTRFPKELEKWRQDDEDTQSLVYFESWTDDTLYGHIRMHNPLVINPLLRTSRSVPKSGPYDVYRWLDPPVIKREFGQRDYLADHRPNAVFKFNIFDLLDMELVRIGAQYICEPPVAVAYLPGQAGYYEVSDYQPRYSSYCSIRVPTGVTVKDVVECSELLLGSMDQ
jgi:hypothetical protein